MKKVLLMAAFAVASLAANAQLYVGGTVGFQTGKQYDGADNVYKFNIAPEIGYNLSEDFAVGIALGFTNYNGDFDAENWAATATKAPESLTDFKISPYARYTFWKTGIASFFIDGGVDIRLRNKDRGTLMGFGLRPGVKLSASEKVDFVAQLGMIGYQFASEKAGKGNTFGLGIDNTTVAFGVYYNF